MVCSIFNKEDMGWVIELKISQQGQDELVWALEDFGQFPIKFTIYAHNLYYFRREEVLGSKNSLSS